MIQHIIDDPLVVADLTGMNPNVFYELAIRHAIRKPLIQIIQKDEKLPFDVAGMRTISVDHRDLDNVEEAKKEIVKQIKAVMKKKLEEIESPITVSLELQALRQSENPEERSFAEFISAVSDLRSDIASINIRLSNPENLFPPAYLRQLLLDTPRRHTRQLNMLIENIHYRFRKIISLEELNKKPSKKMIDEFQSIEAALNGYKEPFGLINVRQLNKLNDSCGKSLSGTAVLRDSVAHHDEWLRYD